MMNRRLTRSAIQAVIAISLTCLIILLLDNRYPVLPSAIYSHLPLHYTGSVVVDINLQTCSKANILSSCRPASRDWHRIDKDLYLGSSWLNKAYIDLKLVWEDDLLHDDRVVIDIKISIQNPALRGASLGHVADWESRPGGIWIKRTRRHLTLDNKDVITAVDILYGRDAADPRPGWELLPTALYLSITGGSFPLSAEPRLSIRRGFSSNTFVKPILRIRRDGKFKILQVSDLHLSTGAGRCRDPFPPMLDLLKCEADPRTLDFVAKILYEEEPDLVVLSGDQVNGETAPDAQTCILKYAELFISHRVPFATIFGNHDDYDKSSLTRMEAMNIISHLPFSLSQAGPENVDGIGNYYIEVLAPTTSHSALTVYFFDTHGRRGGNDGYDWVKENQIEWFRNTSKMLKTAHSKYTHIHLNMAFIHIPVYEYGISTTYDNWYATAGEATRDSRKGKVNSTYTVGSFFGDWKEPVVTSKINTGLRDALAEGDVSVVSCGHDHLNSFCSLSIKAELPRKEQESVPNDKKIWLCYAGGSGLGGYGAPNGYIRRVRVFEFDANSGSLYTWLRLENSSSERHEEHILVNEGKLL